MKQSNAALNRGYVAVHWTYWSSVCSVSMFAGVYLLSRAYTNARIGVLLAIASLSSFLLQPVIGSLADKSKKIRLPTLIALIAGLGAMASLGLMADTANRFTFVLYVFSIVSTQVIQPLISSLCFYIERRGYRINFGLARGSASLLFSAMSVLLGEWTKASGTNVIPLTSMALLLLMAALMALFRGFPASPAQPVLKKSAPDIAGFLQNRNYLLLLLGSVFLFFGHALTNNYYFQIVRNVGGDSSAMGFLISYIAMVELPVMLLFSRLRSRYSCVSMLRVSAVFFTVKMFFTAIAGSMPALYVASTFQALGFALYTPASVRYIGDIMDENNTSRGQSFLSAMVTLGYFTASLAGGLMIDSLGVRLSLLIGSAVSFIGTALMLFGMSTRHDTTDSPAQRENSRYDTRSQGD